MTLDDLIVEIFCLVDDFFKHHVPARSLRKRGPLPILADSEVVTMEVVGEMLRLETDSAIFTYFKRHYSHFFPQLSDRTVFLRQAANLWHVKNLIFKALAARYRDFLHVVDSFPLRVCRFQRARRSKLFRGLAAYGKDLGRETFYGFKLHLKINSLGLIQAFDLVPANVADIHMVWELVEKDSGLLLADRSYGSDTLKQELSQGHNLALSVPTKYSRPSELPKPILRIIKKIRRKIETVFSQMDYYFRIKRIWARDLWHLTNRLIRKVLAHTLSVISCLTEGLEPLRFSKLLAP